MTAKFGTVDKLVLKHLYESENGAVGLYIFHEMYRLAPLQLARCVKRLDFLKLVKVDGEQLVLKDGARKWIFRNRKAVFCNTEELHWKEIPLKYFRKSWDLSFTPSRMNVEPSLYNSSK